MRVAFARRNSYVLCQEKFKMVEEAEETSEANISPQAVLLREPCLEGGKRFVTNQTSG